MPYIPKADRARLDAGDDSRTAGELNYAIHRVIERFLANRELNYDAVNVVVGALECAKLELYRRLAAPYEDRKIESNGDFALYEEPKR